MTAQRHTPRAFAPCFWDQRTRLLVVVAGASPHAGLQPPVARANSLFFSSCERCTVLAMGPKWALDATWRDLPSSPTGGPEEGGQPRWPQRIERLSRHGNCSAGFWKPLP